ncbi:hypothetical protein CC78DRAFT_575998 [Lojkania enalia]|uniref:Uncharacterized protein n=1 Tax=Lojkania enalia TaxID=147567 RepID=A0A9P4KH02_9PLEO|nr:hypothetical protein CC78DRAFT_575998 [Didymosphaeria enalia]
MADSQISDARADIRRDEKCLRRGCNRRRTSYARRGEDAAMVGRYLSLVAGTITRRGGQGKLAVGLERVRYMVVSSNRKNNLSDEFPSGVYEYTAWILTRIKRRERERQREKKNASAIKVPEHDGAPGKCAPCVQVPRPLHMKRSDEACPKRQKQCAPHAPPALAVGDLGALGVGACCDASQDPVCFAQTNKATARQGASHAVSTLALAISGQLSVSGY